MTPTTSGTTTSSLPGIPHRLEVDTDEMARNELTVFVDCRIEDDHGELMGVVGVGVKMRELQQILASFELDFDLTAFLVNREGVVQVHTSDAMIANATIDDLLPVSEYRKKIFTKSRVESSWYKYNGQETCLVTRYIDDLDWYLIVEKDTAIIKESLLSQLWKDILVVACIIILILLLVSGTRIALRQIHDPVCHHGQTHRTHEPGTLQCHPEPETLGTASCIHVRRGPLQTHQRYPRPPLGQ